MDPAGSRPDEGKHGVTLYEIVAAALATARGDAWLDDYHGETFRQDLLWGRAMQGVLPPSTTVVIPDDVLRDVAAKLFAERSEEAARLVRRSVRG